MRWCIQAARDTILWAADVNTRNISSGYIRGNYLSLCRESKPNGPVAKMVTTHTELPRAYQINSDLLIFVEDDG